MLVNQYLHLSLILHKQYNLVARFKAYFHKLYIEAHKDTKKKWNALPYMVKEDDLVELVQTWPT